MYLPSERCDIQRSDRRWAVILAGGDGKRLLPLTRKISGDDRPKQFCPVVGGRTLLDETRDRVSRIVPGGQTFIVVTKSHEQFYTTQLNKPAASSWLVQPRNRGTAPAIAYALMRIHQVDPDAVVAFFPSDHHFADDEKLASCLETAFSAASLPAAPVVLLGIEPDAAEISYGWIEPGARLDAGDGPVYRVERFWEKPPKAVASALMERGCLWNSFVMVGRANSLLTHMQKAIPGLIASLQSARHTFGTPAEEQALDRLYACIHSSSFSDEVLAALPGCCAVLRGSGLGWSDLGEPERVLGLLKRKPVTPEWSCEWAVA